MAALEQAGLRPAVYRFKLGDFDVVSILDSRSVRDGLSSAHGGETFAGDVLALAQANRIDPFRYEHPFIPMLVDTGKNIILFDTGNGALQREQEPLRGRLPDGGLVARLREAGYQPGDVDVVVITHGHPDHIGGLMER